MYRYLCIKIFSLWKIIEQIKYSCYNIFSLSLSFSSLWCSLFLLFCFCVRRCPSSLIWIMVWNRCLETAISQKKHTPTPAHTHIYILYIWGKHNNSICGISFYFLWAAAVIHCCMKSVKFPCREKKNYTNWTTSETERLSTYICVYISDPTSACQKCRPKMKC